MIIVLVLKIIICILTFAVCIVDRVKFLDYVETPQTKRISNILEYIAVVLGIIFCILLIITNWNLFTIPKILLFVSICIGILRKEIGESDGIFNFCVIITLIAYIVAGLKYGINIRLCEDKDVKITSSYNIICAKDNTSINGSMSGIIIFVQGSVSEKSVYQYYYHLEDGGIKQGTIPADKTTIYFIKPEEKPHLDTIVTTTYFLNYNNNPPTRCEETNETTYKLYVPEGSVVNEYKFDAE